MFDIFINKEDEEAKDGSESFTQDNEYNYCRFCDKETLFLYGRCEICKNN